MASLSSDSHDFAGEADTLQSATASSNGRTGDPYHRGPNAGWYDLCWYFPGHEQADVYHAGRRTLFDELRPSERIRRSTRRAWTPGLARTHKGRAECTVHQPLRHRWI